MRRSLMLTAVGLGMVLSLIASPALALSLTGNYYILSSTHPDTSTNPAQIDGSTVSNLVLGALNGPAGVVTSAPDYNVGVVGPNSGAIGDTVGTKIQWWTVHSTGLNVVTADSVPVRVDAFVGNVLGGPGFATNFFPNGGPSDAGGYRAVHWTGAFHVGAGGATVSLTADDDAWLFLNGARRLDNGGVKAISVANTVTTNLVAGDYIVDLFFADRHTTQAGLIFTCEGCLDPVPEPATLLLFGTTLAGLGAVVRRRMKSQKASGA